MAGDFAFVVRQGDHRRPSTITTTLSPDQHRLVGKSMAPSSQSPYSTPFSHSLLAGALAGTAVDTLFFPLDTLKTRAQSHAGFKASGGFVGVYRGLGSAVVGSAPGG